MAATHDDLNTAWVRLNDWWMDLFKDLTGIADLRRLILDVALAGPRLQPKFVQSSWSQLPFGDLGSCRLGKMLDKAKNSGDEYRYLRNTNVQWFRVDLTDLAVMKVRESELDEYVVKAGDLLICEGGQPGRCAIATKSEEGLLFQKALHRFRAHDFVDARFISWSLRHAFETGLINPFLTGTTIKHLTGQSLKRLPILIPDTLEEQSRIADRIDFLWSICDSLESALDQQNQVEASLAAASLRLSAIKV